MSKKGTPYYPVDRCWKGFNMTGEALLPEGINPEHRQRIDAALERSFARLKEELAQSPTDPTNPE